MFIEEQYDNFLIKTKTLNVEKQYKALSSV